MYFQDFLAVPVGAKNYADALNMLSRVRSAASDLLAEDGITTLLADEGGLSPGYSSSEEAFQLMIRAFERAKLRPGHDVAIRSEEHTSELQSLMRISYAVFCLKKKKTKQHNKKH